MDIHEYQAKEVLSRYHIPIPRFGVASSVQEAEQIVKHLHVQRAVVKVQVHAGGRGKAGGVKFAQSREEIIKLAKDMIGMKLVTHQTGPCGIVAHKVLITEPVEIKHEYYVGCVIDREKGQSALIVSPEGGIEIEEVASKTPEKILTLPIGIDGTLRGYQLRHVAAFMQWTGDLAKQGMAIVAKLVKAFTETDASLLEINPLIRTTDDQLWALDAKLSIDDNALFRHPELANYYDPTQQTPGEVAAREYDLAYIALDGEIGCMVNGAGLAMATMDLIQLHGGRPANFLDVGGSATKEKVAAGFKIILSDPKVQGILVNIFGGIMNCATIAEGIIAAAGELDLTVPLVVRMEGTHVERGRELLARSGLNIISAGDLSEAAEKIVKAVH